MPKLADVAEINPRFDRSESNDLSEAISFVPMANVSEILGTITSEENRDLGDVIKGFTTFKDRDVLVAKITPCFENGKIAHARIAKRLGFGSTEFHVVRPVAEMLDDRYLYHFLRQPLVRESGKLRMTGSGGQKRVPKAFLEELNIPLPPLPEQRRIAAILDKADALRAKRREAIAKLDQLLQSMFLEMFGDPVTNPKGWPMKFFGEVCESSFRNGLSPSTSGSVPGKVLTLSAITRQHFQSHHQKEALFDRPPSDNQQVKMDTFLICRGNGNRQLVGVGVFPNHDLYDVCFPDTMIGANIAKDRASPRFIEQIWGSRLVRNQIESGASTTNGTFKINQRTLEKILIPIPPRELQAQFEIISTKLMTMRVRMSIHSRLIDENFRSLQHRMFGAL
ncbi:restriction endonuclease subunit S [Pseudomonas chlororaphis]|uniref:restriction endonuclease subunit S n=1 Tax=Pseudomonas chlororaphis TaxID=587753 RepID=UPI002FCD6B98|nr:restriction endonuclease subunit S [Pseudomonas chlororaphis]